MKYADSLSGVSAIRTGTFIDKLSGVGGLPRGKITEIFGDEGVGKSTLSLQVVRAAQEQDLRCLWADIEWSYDARYAEHLGVDNTKVGLIQERIAEDALDAIESELEEGKWDMVVLDSIGALLVRNEAEKESGSKTIGGQAGLVAKFCRKIVPLLAVHNVALLVINHAYIDLMSGRLLSSGGKKLAYHKSLSIRLKVNTKLQIQQGGRKVGKVVVGEVKKNKLAATEGMELDGQLIFGSGFSASADLLGEALDRGIITKEGQSFFFEGKKLGRGMEAARKAIEADPALVERIKVSLSKP